MICSLPNHDTLMTGGLIADSMSPVPELQVSPLSKQLHRINIQLIKTRRALHMDIFLQRIQPPIPSRPWHGIRPSPQRPQYP